jgi:hypothetical protein
VPKTDELLKLPDLEAIQHDPGGRISKGWAIVSADIEQPLTEEQAKQIIYMALATTQILANE